MKTFFKFFLSNALRLVFLSLLILIGLAFLSVFQKQASADVGFSLSWQDATTIHVSGSITGNLTTALSTDYGFGGTVSGGPNNCNYLSVTVNSSNSAGTVEPFKYAASSTPSYSTQNPCYGNYFSSSQADTTNIPISGTRPTNESHSEEAINVTLQTSHIIIGEAPSKITFTFHSGSSTGAVKDTVSASATDMTNSLQETSANAQVDYTAPTVYLNPGPYTVCFSDLESCQSFNKVTGKPYSQTFNAGPVIPVTVEDNYGGYNSQALTVGPVSLDLEQNSKSLQTIQTDSVTVTPDTQAGSAATSSTVSLSGTFLDVKAGTYQVCPDSSGSLSTSGCVTVTVSADGTVNPSPVVIQDNTEPDTGGSDSSTASCQSSGGPLSWFTCAIINGISSAEQSLEGLLQGLLRTQPVDLNPADCSSGSTSQNYTSCTYNVWSKIRVYGDILLVIALIAIVLVEAIGGGTVGAYSIRRILPRILITAILINISIYIVAGLIDITNIIGNGVYGFITGPFKETGTYHINITAGAGNLFGVSSLLAVVGGAGTIWALASVHGLGDAISFLVLFVAMPVLFAIIGVVLTIFFRMILIVLLLMISPIAFALYCFPNTEKYFQKWWDLLFKTLMVYPIIMLIFAACDLGSVIVSSFPTGGYQWLGELMAIVGVAAPLFLVPFAFKMSGGVIGQVYGGISNFGHKASETIKGNPNDPNSLGRRIGSRFRQRRAEAGITGAAYGTRLNPKYLRKGGRNQRRGALEARRAVDRILMGGEYTDADAIYKTNKQDDNFLLAAVRPDLAKAKLEGIQSSIIKARSEGNVDDVSRLSAKEARWQQAIAKADLVHGSPSVRLSAFQDLNRTGFQWSPGQRGYNQIAETAASITGADLLRDGQGNVIGAQGPNAGSYVEAMDLAQYNLRGAGRIEMGGTNNGTGWDGKMGIRKLGNYGRGQGKTETYHGAAASWLGNRVVDDSGYTLSSASDISTAVEAGLADGSIDQGQDGVTEYYSMLIRDLPSATDANKLEIQKQITALKGVSNAALQTRLQQADQELRLTQIPESERQSGGQPDQT